VLGTVQEFGRRASSSELDSLGSQTCSICFDAFTSPVVLPCGHSFCEHCIMQWLFRDATCPVCRQPAVPLEIVSETGTFFGGEGSTPLIEDHRGTSRTPTTNLADCVLV